MVYVLGPFGQKGLAKKDAYHHPHVDCTGMRTWIAIEDGLKRWNFLFPPVEISRDEEASLEIHSELMGFKTQADSEEHGWRWFSILLHPGSVL